MANDKTTWRLILTTLAGDPLFTLRVESEEAEGPKPSPTPPAATAARPQPIPPAPQGDGEPRMTEPQKRYLFRLLAEQSVEGKKAEEHLKDYFKVKTLRDVSKSAASQLIEQMVADKKEARDGAA